jgi:hypothetical protein
MSLPLYQSGKAHSLWVPWSFLERERAPDGN